MIQMAMEERALRKLIWKLKMAGDITLEEADQICSVMRSFAQDVANVFSQNPALDITEIYSMLSKDYHVEASQDWCRAVAHKIKKGQKGNFIFSIPLEHGNPKFYEFQFPIIKAAEKNESIEDRIISMRVGSKMYNSFPKYFQNLFKWEEQDKMYILNGDRFGFFYYPRRDPESGKAFTIAQIFQKLFLFSVTILPEEVPQISMFDAAEHASKYLKQNAFFVKMYIKKPLDKENAFYFNAKNVSMTRTSATRYALEYLKQKAPYIEVCAMGPYGKEIITYTNTEGMSMTKKVFEISIEELLENAVKRNIIDEDTAKEFLKNDGYIDRFPDKEFIEASLEYIDKRMKRKREWKNTRKTIEEENGWLEEIR